MTCPVYICDRCGRPMFAGETRYQVRLVVQAAADPLEITLEELRRDHTILREHLIEQSEAMTESEIMEDVHAERAYSLCRRCRIAWLRNPLGGG